MVSNIEGRNGTPPTIDDFLRDTALVVSQEFIDAQQQFRSIPKIRPVTGIISRGFDPTIPHKAIDFVAPRGTPVRATADGVVSQVFFDLDMGHVVMITHSYGYETLYAHCEKILVSVGQTVVQGQTIALVGNTGRATRGYHLHYEVLRNGQQIDPKTLFL
jgi:murein DD-endopeptidase MepM/ murein hydrolase activator NlpD